MTNTFENGFINYNVAMLRAFSHVIEKARKKSSASESQKAFRNILFDLGGPRSVNSLPMNSELFAGKIFHGFNEIYNSYNALFAIPTYMRRFPSNLGHISKSDYLRYHITNYLNETYILKERLYAYKKIVSRAYRKSSKLAEMKIQLEALEEVWEKVTQKFNEARGSHVHEARFDEPDLDRLSLLDLLSRNLDDKDVVIIRYLYRNAIRDTRKKWLNIMEKNNQQITGLLDIYFGILHPLIFDKKGYIIIPFDKHMKGNST